MSRSITLSYRFEGLSEWVEVPVQEPYYLLGTQNASKEFWALPILKEIGITELTQLGTADPICFIGPDGMADLKKELQLLQDHFHEIDWHVDVKARWLAHLLYCYHMLIDSTPEGAISEFMIG